ncbi:MAG: ThiF family adenylyltransferase [Paenibacillaceae bacterium]
MNKTPIEQDSRYSRQRLFSPIGEAGQLKLSQSRVAIVGMGALGTVLANHMVRAGVGFIRIIDRDFVEWSNLQRQMLFDEQDALQSAPKALAAANRLRQINSFVEIEPHVTDLNPTNVRTLLTDVDVILDGSDNFAVRFLINDVCMKTSIPWVYGGAVGSRGVSMTILPQQTPCFRCMFGQAPQQGTGETCDTIGVIGPIVDLVASHQATEALKLLVGDIQHLNLHLVHYDLWLNQHSSINVSKAHKDDCPACKKGQYDYLNADLEGETIQTLCGRNSVQIHPIENRQYDLAAWAAKWGRLGIVHLSPFLLKFSINSDHTLVLFPDGRVIIQGTDNIIEAKSLYTRYIGT